MKHLLNCPVCRYTEISGNICPNCDADLSLIRSLTELTPSSLPLTQKVARWQVGVALLILMVGIGLGVLCSFLFLQPSQLLVNTVNYPSPVKGQTKTPSPIAQAPVKLQQPTQYTVKPGDNLTAITEQFCGQGKSWQVMVKANPQLKGREDWIDVGEVLKLPNCEG